MASQVHPTLRLGSRGAAVKDMHALAYKVVTAGFGHPVYYRWGARVSGLDLHHPATWTHMDCSEFTQGCATVHTGHEWHDGAANQYNHCNHIGVSKAIGTPGALLFIYGHVMGHPNPYIHHVAVSLGDGRTAEFRSRKMGAGVWSAHGRFTHAGLIPGIHY
jgi:cell wall-associated NlpC family hydrolase